MYESFLGGKFKEHSSQWGQCSSLVAHWHSVPGDHSSDPRGGENFPLLFLSRNLVIAVNFKLIHTYAK